jgi:hypothetical protein
MHEQILRHSLLELWMLKPDHWRGCLRDLFRFFFFFVVSLYDVVFPVVISFSKCRRWLSFLVVVGLLTVSSLCLRYCELEFCSVRSCSLVVVKNAA